MNIAINDKNKKNVIATACAYKQISDNLLRTIIQDHDCNVSNPDFLINAIGNKSFDKATILLDLGAGINNRTITTAIKSGHEYVNLLIDYGVTTGQIAQCLIKSIKNIGVFQLLIASGIDLNSCIMNN